MDLSDKTVVVTGAGSGIGRALAIGFCSDGASVVAAGRSRSELDATARLCRAATVHCVVADLARAEDVERLLSGRVDMLVNNAAAYPKTAFLESSHEEWSRVIHTNLIAMAQCCRCVLPGMLARGFGRIVNLGSFAWKAPIPNSSAYSVSKAGVRALTRAIAAEIDRARYPDVLVNELNPGTVRTRMSEWGIEPQDVYPHARFVATLPRGGPTGQTFLQSTLHIEDYGIRARLKRLIGR